MLFQVDIKEQRLAGLRGELAAAAEEVAAQRARGKEGDQMLAREKGRSEVVRKELRAAKEQLAGTKSKLGAALKDAAEANVRATGAPLWTHNPAGIDSPYPEGSPGHAEWRSVLRVWVRGGCRAAGGARRREGAAGGARRRPQGVDVPLRAATRRGGAR